MSFLVLKFNELTKIIYLFVGLTGVFIGLIQFVNWLVAGSLTLLQSLTPSITVSLFILGLLLRTVTPISTLNKLFKLNRRITTFFIHNDADRM